MSRIKLHLLLLALLGIGAAWVNKPLHSSPHTSHNYSFLYKSTDGTRMYYGKDLTSLGYVKGFDYICISSSATCTFYGDPSKAHSDLTGTWFYVWDVPTGGLDNSGIYYDSF